jgi:CobQ-like glutamine amidotransferase family enzyme
MNIYGDRGNIMTFARRAEWRGIGLTVDTVEVGDALKAADYDLFFFGGGQDQEQDTVAADLVGKAAALREAAETGAAMLAVCGGYQLFGRYYQPAEGERLEGVGIFDAWTEAGPDRLIGNVVVEPTAPELAGRPIVGFENHSGLTHLAEGAQPLGRVIKGAGNTGRDGTEGCVAGSAVGTYLHGSLLPKNPHLADWLLGRAVARRHPAVELQPLDDSLEQATNATMVKRFS